MRGSLLVFLPLALSVGCKNDYNIKTYEAEEEVLTLNVASPAYGVFLGDSPAVVQGIVTPSHAVLEIEGQRVFPSEDGSFSVEVPVDAAYRNLDVRATLGTQEERWRTPVFRGEDPSLTWPGGVTLRLLPQGMERMGLYVGQMIDNTGWSTQIEALLPAYEGSLFQVRPVGVFHDPTVVDLYPADGTIGTGVTLGNLKLEYEAAVDAIGLSVELSIAFAEIGIDATMTPWLDSDGILWLGLDNPAITLGEADVTLGPLDGWLTELIIDWVNQYVLAPLGDLLLGFVIDQFAELEVGGPLSTEMDLLGTPLSVALTELYTETLGLGADIGIGIGSPAATGSLGIVIPDETTPGTENADLAVAMHEGLLQVAMGDLLFSVFDSQLDGLLAMAGPILGNVFTALPGGEQAPAEAEWCFSFEPGDAYVARMHEGTAPLGSIYLPDFGIIAGTKTGAVCETWLDVTMALELDLVVEDGSKLGFAIHMPEGAVRSYGAEGVDEQEVVTALGNALSGTLGALLGSFSIDLADLAGAGGTTDPTNPLGGLLGELNIEIQDARRFDTGPAAEDESMYAVSLRLFPQE